MKATSKAVKKSRAATGVSPTSLNLTDEQRVLIDAFARTRGLNRTQAIIQAVREAVQRDAGVDDMTPLQALRVLERAVTVRKKN